MACLSGNATGIALFGYVCVCVSCVPCCLPVNTTWSVNKIAEFCPLVFCLKGKHVITLTIMRMEEKKNQHTHTQPHSHVIHLIRFTHEKMFLRRWEELLLCWWYCGREWRDALLTRCIHWEEESGLGGGWMRKWLSQAPLQLNNLCSRCCYVAPWAAYLTRNTDRLWLLPSSPAAVHELCSEAFRAEWRTRFKPQPSLQITAKPSNMTRWAH